jgi:hypothetical protein
MKSFTAIICAIALATITQVQADTPALRGEGIEIKLANPSLIGTRPGEPDPLRWCNRWPFYCNEK